MKINATLKLNANEFNDSLDAVRLEVNYIRSKAIQNKQCLPEIIVPLELNGGMIYLVLNNNEDNNTYPYNLYVRQILDANSEALYDIGHNTEGYIDYGNTLPTVNFSQYANAWRYDNIIESLNGNYYQNVRPVVIQIAMIVEAIRLYPVGDAINDALMDNSVVHFAIHNDLIRGGWSAASDEYIQYLKLFFEDNSNIGLLYPENVDDSTNSHLQYDINSVAALTTKDLIELFALYKLSGYIYDYFTQDDHDKNA